MIEVSHLSKRYGDHYAVKDLSFTVEKGQVYGFLGPNGAGKSTTMNIMTGYIAATEGTVTINGHDIVKEPEEAKKCIGYLPEIPPLYQDMTVYEYLMFVAELKKVAKSDRGAQVESAMQATFITDMKNRLIKNLSKGYKQRVGLSQAMLGNPEVIILDEPTVGLDPMQIIEIRELIRELKKEHTVILSSHILSEVAEVCDHIMIIAKGKLVASDTSEGLIESMSAQDTLELEIKGSNEQVIEMLNKIDAIDDRTVEYDESNGICKIVLKVKNGSDIRELVFNECVNAKLPIYKMVLNTKTLEEVFLELTQQAAQEAEAEEASKESMDNTADAGEETVKEEE